MANVANKTQSLSRQFELFSFKLILDIKSIRVE